MREILKIRSLANNIWRGSYVGSKIWYRDFPSHPVVKNPPSNARDVGVIPGERTKIPHAKEQLSPPTTAREKLVHHSQELMQSNK